MTLPVVWIPDANEDLLEARSWYNNIRSELGERFALAVQATIESIAEHPMQFPVVYRSRRRAGVRRFPYGLFFEVQEAENCAHRVLPQPAQPWTLAIAVVGSPGLLLRRLGQYLLEESLLRGGLPQFGVAIHVGR